MNGENRRFFCRVAEQGQSVAFLEHTAVRGSWMRLLERALREREPLTLSQVAARWLGS